MQLAFLLTQLAFLLAQPTFLLAQLAFLFAQPTFLLAQPTFLLAQLQKKKNILQNQLPIKKGRHKADLIINGIIINYFISLINSRIVLAILLCSLSSVRYFLSLLFDKKPSSIQTAGASDFSITNSLASFIPLDFRL